MRRLAILALLAALAVPAMAAPAVVQSAGCGNYNASVTCTLSSAVASGDVLVQIAVSNVTTATFSVSGCGATWTSEGGGSDTNGAVFVFVGTAGSGTCSTSQTVSGGNFNDAALLELSGVGSIDGSAAITYTSCGGTGSCSGPAVTTTVSGDIVICGGTDIQSDAITPVWASPFSSSLNDQIASPDTVTVSAASALPASTGSITPTFTSSGGASAYYHLGAIAFEPSAGPPPCPHTLMTLGVGCG